jgi:hypothetical protein
MSGPRALACPACGAPVEPEEGGGDVARCRFCRAVVRMPADPSAGTPSPPAGRRAPVPLPKGVRVEDTAAGFRLTRRWFHPIFVFLAFFSAVWLGMLAFFYGMILDGNAPGIVALFPILHVAVGVGLAYWTLCGFINATTVAAERGEIDVRHAPLPWPGGGTYAAADVAQVFVREKVHPQKNGGSSTTYEVHVLTRSGAAKRLLSGLLDVEQALYVEQELERRLRIPDRPVPGEVARA